MEYSEVLDVGYSPCTQPTNQPTWGRVSSGASDQTLFVLMQGKDTKGTQHKPQTISFHVKLHDNNQE